jgi:TonB-linked SusC/RagA family outer membrane protein
MKQTSSLSKNRSRSLLSCLAAGMLFLGTWLLATSNLQAQVQPAGLSVSGQVLDEFEAPMTGVTVSVEGTTNGVITDLEGRFTLTVPNEQATLRFRFIGYQSQLLSVGSNRTFNVRLQPVVQDLDEVVVIGYGEIRKRDLTGAVSSVKTADIVKLPTHNPVEALQGKIPGMDIVRSSGNAGAGVNITIRGNRSINGDNSPLFVIDGIQGGSYNDLNPGDIESIEVLKDASSTAIYGSQGANGVVIITTKKGAAGKTKVSYDGYYGINGVVDYPNPLIGDAYLDYVREGKVAAGTYTTDEAMFLSDVWNAVQANQWVNWIKAKNPNILDVKTHHMYRPIPQIEVETMLNFDEFGQNPGYDTEN